MPSNATQNYQLNQWSRDDPVRMEDFNADNAKIDAAIKAVDQRVDGLSASKADVSALSAFGNCRIESGSYYGDGKENRVMTITASFKPMVVMILGGNCNILVRGESPVFTFYNGTLCGSILVTWEENSVSWKPEYSYSAAAFLNDTRLYHYVVLG